jgi:hypothetical protein
MVPFELRVTGEMLPLLERMLSVLCVSVLR